MTRVENMEDPDSCLMRAENDEPLFILRSKDPTSPILVIAWILLRVFLFQKNSLQDMQVRESFDLAEEMQRWRDKNV